MFHDTNSIKTFRQPSHKMLNCSKYKNWIKFCFHNWTQTFCPIISWQLYKSWWNTVWVKQNCDWDPEDLGQTLPSQPVGKALGSATAHDTHFQPYSWSKHVLRGNGRGQETIKVTSLNTSRLTLGPSTSLSFPEDSRGAPSCSPPA